MSNDSKKDKSSLTIEKIEALIKPIKQRIAVQLGKINFPVNVTEILMTPKADYTLDKRESKDEKQYVLIREPKHGEFEYKLKEDAHNRFIYAKERRLNIVKFVAELGEIAAKIHSPEDPNQITRINLPECALYPAKDSGPIMEPEFSMLLEDIIKIAQRLPQNIHLNLGTIPWGFTDDKGKKFFLNLNLYVIGGEEPRINVAPKMFNFSKDPQYPDFQLYTLFDADEEAKAVARLKPIKIKGMVHSHLLQGNVIDCVTKGGARFTVVTDICLDHHQQVGINTLRDRIIRESADTELQSMGTSQILISNTTCLNRNSIISQAIVHADKSDLNARVLVREDSEQKYLKKIKAKESLKEQKFAFGGIYRGRIYPAYEIKSNKEIEFIIHLRNEILKAMWPLKLYREQHPDSHTIELINHKIIEEFSKYLSSTLTILSKNIKSKAIYRTLIVRAREIAQLTQHEQVSAMLNFSAELQNIAEKISQNDELGSVLLFGIGEIFRRTLFTYLPSYISEQEAKVAVIA